MPNILIIKVADDHLMTHFKVNGDYSELADRVTMLMDLYHPGEVADAYALCCSDKLRTAVALPKGWRTGPDDPGNPIPCDFRVMLKSAVTTETILPPMGMTVEDLLDTDPVVCHV